MAKKKYGDPEAIATFNRENGTNFWRQDQIDAYRKENNPIRKFLNTSVKVPVMYGTATTPYLVGKDIPTVDSTVGQELGQAAAAITTPMLFGEFAAGAVPGIIKILGGTAGAAAGSYAGKKVGDWADKQLGTTVLGDIGGFVGGLGGWGAGSKAGYKGLINYATKYPFKLGTSTQFRSDVVGKAFADSAKDHNIKIGPLRHAKKYDLTPDHSNMGISEYELFDTLTGKSIGKMGATFDKRFATKGIQHVDNIVGSEGNRGVSRSLYNAALVDEPSGLVSGENLVHPEITEKVWKHFPREVISNRGYRPSETGVKFGDVVRLKAPETYIPTLEKDNIIEIPKRTQIGKTYLRLLEKSSTLSEAEKLGIPKALRSDPRALEDPQYWGYQQWNGRYNSAVESGNWGEAQRLRDLHFKVKAPDTKVVDENGNPLHMYHGIADRSTKPKRFQQYRGVNWDVEDAVKTGDKRNHWKISEPNDDVMNNYHTPNYQTAKSSYALGKDDLVYDDYLNIKKPFTYDQENLHNIVNLEIPEYSKKISHIEREHYGQYPIKDSNGNYVRDLNGKVVWGSKLYPERQYFEYTGVPDWSRFNGVARETLMQQGYDGLFIPQYYDSYGAFVSPSQFKSADPITWNGKGEIIPIVKRDNFHNLDRRYKQGGKIDE